MSLKHLLFFFTLAPFIFALELQDEYTISGSDFNASLIHPSIKNDFILFQFENNKHQKSFTSSKLIKQFHQRGIEINDASKGIVHVKRRSGFDEKPIKEKIRAYYHSFYPSMNIKAVYLEENAFIQNFADDYELHFKNNSYLYNRSSLHISSPQDKKRHFLKYQLKAYMKVFKASHNINRGKILSQRDFDYKEDEFKRYKGLPLLSISKGKIRLKKRLAKGKIFYQKDIERVPDVLKGKSVNVRLISGKIKLEFQAISLEDGHVGNEISIKKRDGTKLKAKVISTNLVEIQ